MKKIFLILIISCFAAHTKATTLSISRGDGQYPPFEWKKDGKLTGIHIDFVQLAAKNVGLKLEIQSLPWARAVKYLKLGNTAGLLFMSENPTRKKFAIFLSGNIISRTQLKIFGLKKNINSLRFSGKMTAFKERTIGHQRGYSYGKEFDNSILFKKVEVESKAQLLSMAVKNKIDFGIVNQLEMIYEFRDNPNLKKISWLDIPIEESDVYIAFSKKQKLGDIPQKFAKELTKLKKIGEYDKIVKKYLK